MGSAAREKGAPPVEASVLLLSLTFVYVASASTSDSTSVFVPHGTFDPISACASTLTSALPLHSNIRFILRLHFHSTSSASSGLQTYVLDVRSCADDSCESRSHMSHACGLVSESRSGKWNSPCPYSPRRVSYPLLGSTISITASPRFSLRHSCARIYYRRCRGAESPEPRCHTQSLGVISERITSPRSATTMTSTNDVVGSIILPILPQRGRTAGVNFLITLTAPTTATDYRLATPTKGANMSPSRFGTLPRKRLPRRRSSFTFYLTRQKKPSEDYVPPWEPRLA